MAELIVYYGLLSGAIAAGVGYSLRLYHEHKRSRHQP